MGKIIGSWLVKVHLHGEDDDADAADVPTNEQVKDAIVETLGEELEGEITVSLIERTDD